MHTPVGWSLLSRGRNERERQKRQGKDTPARLAGYDLRVGGVHVDETIAVGETAAAVAACVRPVNVPPEPRAMKALASLCPQSE